MIYDAQLIFSAEAGTEAGGCTLARCLQSPGQLSCQPPGLPWFVHSNCSFSCDIRSAPAVLPAVFA